MTNSFLLYREHSRLAGRKKKLSLLEYKKLIIKYLLSGVRKEKDIPPTKK